MKLWFIDKVIETSHLCSFEILYVTSEHMTLNLYLTYSIHLKCFIVYFWVSQKRMYSHQACNAHSPLEKFHVMCKRFNSNTKNMMICNSQLSKKVGNTPIHSRLRNFHSLTWTYLFWCTWYRCFSCRNSSSYLVLFKK